MSENSYSVDIEVRLRDLDTMKHVNNAVYSTYLEQARLHYYRDVIREELADVDTVIVDLGISFERPITSNQDVTIDVWVPELGTSSMPMRYEVRADGKVVATAETVQVYVDGETGAAEPLPDEWVNRISDRHGL